MHYEGRRLSAHSVLEQQCSKGVAVTGKAIRKAVIEHEELWHAYKRTVEEYDQLKRMYDQLTDEWNKELLHKNGTDAVVGAIRELTDVVRQAALPPPMM